MYIQTMNLHYKTESEHKYMFSANGNFLLRIGLTLLDAPPIYFVCSPCEEHFIWLILSIHNFGTSTWVLNTISCLFLFFLTILSQRRVPIEMGFYKVKCNDMWVLIQSNYLWSCLLNSYLNKYSKNNKTQITIHLRKSRERRGLQRVMHVLQHEWVWRLFT